MLFGFVEVWVQRILTACYSVSFDHIITENHSAVLLWSDVIFWNKINSLKLHIREAIGFLPKLEVKPVLNERDFWAVLCFDGTAVCSHPSVHKQPIANVSTHSALGKLVFHWGRISRDILFLWFPRPMRQNQKNKTIFIIYLFVLTLLSLFYFWFYFVKRGLTLQICLMDNVRKYVWTFDMFLTPFKWRLEICD